MSLVVRRIGLAIAAVAVVALVAAAVTKRVMRYRPVAVHAGNAVGDATCLSCHSDKSTFETTAHRLTSRQPTGSSIHGSFRLGENVLRTSNRDLEFRMDATDSGFYQTAITGPAYDTTVESNRIAFVVGSGRKGQSYLWHEGDRLFQLPVSTWVGLGWINSPGYRDGLVEFNRPIPPRCLECHSSGFESVADPTVVNRYCLSNPMLGITCETCHTSGEEHVRRERSSLRALPPSLVPRAIVNPARLSRQRRLDQCALCHNGALANKSPAFSYVPGQPIRDHLETPPMSFTDAVDVHGNQVALLERSQCFQKSQMTCTTCHDVHQTQRDTVALSARCLTCHTAQSCGLYPKEGNRLVGRCVDCHMPKQPSNVIVSNFEGQRERPLVRTHLIKVYPQRQGP